MSVHRWICHISYREICRSMLNVEDMDFIFKVFMFCLKIIGNTIRPILVASAKGQKQTVTPVTNNLLKISAKDLAIKIRNKEISAEEICKAYITRIKEVNQLLNAVVEDRFEAAIVDAKSIDNYLSKCYLSKAELERTKPLLGVPFTVKESCSVQGLEYSIGHLKRVGTKASADGDVVALMKDSGAIPLLVSTTSELCLSTCSNNMVTGTTNNPYDTTCTAGGSSSGEGALLGSAASVIGIGSDLVGSIRNPAAFNGVFGHKPTSRTISSIGHCPYGLDDFATIGPMTRYAEDLKLILDIIYLPEVKGRLRLNEKVDLSNIEVSFMEDFDDFTFPDTDTEIKEAICKAAKYLQTNFGSTIVNKKITDLKNSIGPCIQSLLTSEDMVTCMKKFLPSEREIFKSFFTRSNYSTEFHIFLMQRKLATTLLSDMSDRLVTSQTNISNFLGDNRILLFPTSKSCAGKHSEFLINLFDVGYTIFANAYGLPATNVPCGLNRNGMPIALQVVAGPYQDRLCLAVAEELEKCFGGWIPPH